MKNPLNTQVGGSHYRDCAIQPVQFIEANGLGFCEGNIIKYVTRHAAKNGKADLEKARAIGGGNVSVGIRLAVDEREGAGHDL